MSTAPRVTPQQAWETFIAGNERFITGVSNHPNQDVERRSELVNSQSPDVALFGCSDSRLAAEIIFDQGLGDLFVVRSAGLPAGDGITVALGFDAGTVVQPPGRVADPAADFGAAIAAAVEQQGAAGSADSLEGFDILDGGAGTDTLSATVNF